MQMDRLFGIVYVLQEREAVSARELAARFEVSVKTIYRDVEKLSLAGIPVYASRGRGGGISLISGFVMDKALLTQEDKLNIGSAISAFEKIDPSGTLANTEQFKAFLGSAQDWIEVDFSSWGNPGRERALFSALKQAVLHKQEIEFFYRNARGEGARRRVQPLKLGFRGHAWYVYGYCIDKQAERFFKLSRISAFTVTARTFHRQAPARIFSDTGIYEQARTKIELRLSAKMGYRAYEEFETVRELEDGTFLVSLEYPMGPMLYSYLLSFGTGCEVLLPAEVRRGYLQELKKVLQAYEKADT